MNGNDVIESEKIQEMDEEIGDSLLRPLIESNPTKKSLQPVTPADPSGVIIGELIGMTDEGSTPLVVYSGQPGTAALQARATVDLHGAHIGRQVVIMFEAKNLAKPIIMGVLREGEGWPLEQRPDQVEVDVDGERMIVNAKEQLVLKCGKASITLTKAGKVLIKGKYVLSRSSGVNRIKGGSVQLN